MNIFQNLLIKLNACESAVEWAGDMTVEEVVAKCHRGDWLLWLAEEVGVEKRLLILAGGLSANTVRHLMNDERSTNAVDVYIRYGCGEATDGELAAANEAAEEAAEEAADAAADAAAWVAAWAAANAAWVAANAAWVAANAASEPRATKVANQHQTADIARKVCGSRIIELVNEMLESE